MMNELLKMRDELWDDHPLICESAILPTQSVQDAVARVLQASRKSRSSLAWWADPQTGKSSCMKMIQSVVQQKFPGCGCVYMEPVDDVGPTEGRLLEHILKEIGYVSKIERSLAGKRDQVHRALYALSGTAKRLFILIDEAQGLDFKEYGWLKAIINRLVRLGVKIMCVMAGQKELKTRVSQLEHEGRSDLAKRFFSKLFCFQGCRTAQEFKVIAVSIDEKSEYPLGSKLSYTQLLFPMGYGAGFRFADFASTVWERLRVKCGKHAIKAGLSMELIAGTWANICLLHRERDREGFTLEVDLIDKAIEAAL